MKLRVDAYVGVSSRYVERILDLPRVVAFLTVVDLLVLERSRELVESGLSFDEAREIVRDTSVFTTHTPVPAGHDAFPFQMMDRYFPDWHDRLKITREEFLDLARQDQSWGPTFSMTVLALKMSGKHNGVSKLHGEVSRKMWSWLWPKKKLSEIPITHVTNGIHTETWLAPELKTLFDRYLPSNWVMSIDDPATWENIERIPDEELWDIIDPLVVEALTQHHGLDDLSVPLEAEGHMSREWGGLK